MCVLNGTMVANREDAFRTIHTKLLVDDLKERIKERMPVYILDHTLKKCLVMWGILLT